jgi:FXSXX-COOH protein
MTDSSTQPGAEETDLALLKLDREILGQLLKSNSSSLTAAMQRVVDEAAGRTVNYAAFGNAP